MNVIFKFRVFKKGRYRRMADRTKSWYIELLVINLYPTIKIHSFNTISLISSYKLEKIENTLYEARQLGLGC